MAQHEKGQEQRGFAGMDPDKQREIAQKGGESVADEKRSFSQDRELAAEAGREGGHRSHEDRSHAGSKPGAGHQGGQHEGASHHGGSGNFAEDRERASEAGRKGGRS